MHSNTSSQGTGSERHHDIGPAPHPRSIGWIGTTALALGGSNQSLFLIAGAGGLIATQGSAAVPLLVLGLLLSWMALPGWTELVLMWPNRVGGIAATCSEAFRPISPVLANLTGVCYWWGWIPPCGLTAWLAAKAITTFYLPRIPDKPLAIAIVLAFTILNLFGIRRTVRFAVPMATISALLALLSGLVPAVTGRVNWEQATTYHLVSPFPGWFGGWTSAMSGLYLIGFAAPAFEQALSHVGETIDPNRNVPRAVYASAIMATLFFLVLPVVWLGVLGVGPTTGLVGELQDVLGPTLQPLLGRFAIAAGVWFMVFNMLHGTLTPLAGPARTLSQLAEDGLMPRAFARRNRYDAPWVATCFNAAFAILFLLLNDPVWLLAAANLCYLIGICLPSIAVRLLRRSAPDLHRPFRAPLWAINMGVVAAIGWGVSTVFGFQQYGLPAIVVGVALAYFGSVLYAIRRWEDRGLTKSSGIVGSLHLKLTGAMIAVLTLDAAGYLMAVSQISADKLLLITVLEDIFVLVALLTIGVGLVLPGIITHAAEELSQAARELAQGTMKDFSRAMGALAAGDLDGAHARVDTLPIEIHSRDEIGAMAASFNTLREEIEQAVTGLDGAREGLRDARAALTQINLELEGKIVEADRANAAKSEFLSRMSHELRTPLNAILGFGQILQRVEMSPMAKESLGHIQKGGRHLLDLINEVLDISRVESGHMDVALEAVALGDIVPEACALVSLLAAERGIRLTENTGDFAQKLVLADRQRLKQVLINLLANAIKYNREAGSVDVFCGRAGDGTMTIAVRDSGPGLTASDMTKLFTPFERLGASNSDVQGTGLGLVLSRSLMTAMGGTLTAESVLGRGSSFTITLPGTTAPLHQLVSDGGVHYPDSHEESESSKVVLCIEDNASNLRLLEIVLLDRPEITLITAIQGSVGLDLARQHLPDLILLDLNLPDISGRDVLTRLKLSAATTDIPVIILSADASEHQVATLMGEGAKAFLTKPLDVTEFLDTVDQWLDTAPRTVA